MGLIVALIIWIFALIVLTSPWERNPDAKFSLGLAGLIFILVGIAALFSAIPAI